MHKGLKALIVLLVLIAAALGLYGWATHWTPSRELHPTQGVAASAETGAISWPGLRAEGADFAYILATSGAHHRDPRFAANRRGAIEAGLRYGVVHHFSLCDSARAQATAFIATVPRDNSALPPAVRLDYDGKCRERPDRAVLLQRLTEFLNEIEHHLGKPAIIELTKPFNDDYDIAGGINRTLWLDRDFLVPDYAGRPWVMWRASDMLQMNAAEHAVDWVVVQ